MGEYILITPIRNEQESIGTLKETILAQTHRPLLWAVINSGSTDDTQQMLEDMQKEIPWMTIRNQRVFHEAGYSHKNFAQAVTEGYELARDEAERRGIRYDYYGKTDATPLLAPNYFETLCNLMDRHPRVAISAGVQSYKTRTKTITMKPRHPVLRLNDIRLYQKAFLDAEGGYPRCYSPDTVLAIKATSSGMETAISPEARFTKTRLGGSKIGVWKGYQVKGRAMRALWFRPEVALAIAIYNSISYPPHYQGLAMVAGYFRSWRENEARVEDVGVREYFRKLGIARVIRGG